MRSRMPDTWSDSQCRELFHRAMKLSECNDEPAQMLVSALGRAVLYGQYDRVRAYVRNHVTDVYHIWTT